MSLSAAEEADLIARHRAGDRRAADEIIRAFAPMVMAFVRKRARFRVDLEDLVQEANMGLVRALEKFDPDNGNRFGVYAKWWVRACVDEYIGRNWSMVRGMQRKHGQSAIVTVYNAIGRGEGSASMHIPLRDHRGEWGDLFADTSPSPEQRCLLSQELAALDAMMDRLTPTERIVIARRWRTDAWVRLRDVGHELGLSHERIRQLEQSALRKLGVAKVPYTHAEM